MPGTRFLLVLAAIPFAGDAAAQSSNRPIVPPPVVRPLPAPLPDMSRMAAPREEEESEAAEGEEDGSNPTADKETAVTQPSNIPAAERLAPEPVPDGTEAPERNIAAIMRAPVPPARSDSAATASAGIGPDRPSTETGRSGRGAVFAEGIPTSQRRRIPDYLRAAFAGIDPEFLRDLMAWLEMQRAVDLEALGRGDDGRFNWEARTGHDRERGQGVISRLQERGGGIDPSIERDGSDDRRRSSGASSVFGPSARAGSIVSRDGLTSQDGASDDSDNDGGASGDDDSGGEWSSCGVNCIETTYVDEDGKRTHHRIQIFPAPDNTADDGYADNGPEGESVIFWDTKVVHSDGQGFSVSTSSFVDKNGRLYFDDPSRQPTDPQYGSGGDSYFFECFDPVAPCIKSELDWRDTVSQPGMADSEAVHGPGTSVGERLRAVTQPLPDGSDGGGTGGGSQPPDPCIAADCDDRRPGEP